MAHCARDAAGVPPSERTESMIQDIVAFFLEVGFMQELHVDELTTLATRMTLQSFPRDSIVFVYGDHGDACYVILVGSVILSMPDNGQTTKLVGSDHPDKQIETVAFSVGDVFGERALYGDSLRTATISCSKDGLDALVITREDFQQCLEDHRHLVETRMAFLRKCLLSHPVDESLYFNSSSEDSVPDAVDFKMLSSCLVKHDHFGQRLLCQQGREAAQIIFVDKGELLVYRSIRVVNGVPQKRRLSAKHSHKNVLLCIGRMQPLTHYGVVEVLSRSENTISLVARTYCSVYTIGRNDVNRRLPMNLVDALRKSPNSLPIPPDKELWELSQMNTRWQQYKGDLLECRGATPRTKYALRDGGESPRTKYALRDGGATPRTKYALRDGDVKYFSGTSARLLSKSGYPPQEWEKSMDMRDSMTDCNQVFGAAQTVRKAARQFSLLLQEPKVKRKEELKPKPSYQRQLLLPLKALVPQCNRQASNVAHTDPYKRHALARWKRVPIDSHLL